MEYVHNIAELMSRNNWTATQAFTYAAADNLPTYFPGSQEPYSIYSNITYQVDANPVKIFGDGAHASVIEFTSTNLGLVIDQRDNVQLSHFDNWQSDISDLCIRYSSAKHGDPGTAALKLYGRGTANAIHGLHSIRRVQFGRADKRNPGNMASPGTWEYYPEMWIDASGIFGMEIQRANFGGQIHGSLIYPTSYYPAAGIRFTDNAGVFTDLSGKRYSVRSMRNTIRGCGFGVCRIGVECEEEHHIEGTLIDNSAFVGGWGGIHIRGDKLHNTEFTVRDSHMSFRRFAMRVEAGAGINLRNNYMIARSDGYFLPTAEGPLPHYIQLGEAGEDHGAVLSTVSQNIFGRSPTTCPQYGTVIDGNSDLVNVTGNMYQGTPNPVAVMGNECSEIYHNGLKLA